MCCVPEADLPVECKYHFCEYFVKIVYLYYIFYVVPGRSGNSQVYKHSTETMDADGAPG